MHIRYLKNGEKHSARKTNEDVTFITKIENNRVKLSIKAKADITLLYASSVVPFEFSKNDLYFLNGYQSWTDTKEFTVKDKVKDVLRTVPNFLIKKYGLDGYGDCRFYEYGKGKKHGYDVFYVRGDNEVFIYNYNYRTAYLIVEVIKNSENLHLLSDVKGLHVKKGEEVAIFDYFHCNDFLLGVEHFHQDFPKLNTEKLFGYTSWYNYYQNINEEIILRDLEGLDSRFNIFQIDDGYETFVGDWFDVDPVKFPNGLAPIVQKIHQKGYKAGLWLAPFVAETKSKVFQEHQDWIKKDENGNLLKAGANWSGFYCLDLQNPEVVQYIKKCLEHYMEMGFDFYKLDFLYACALGPVEGKTRCMNQYESYKLLRDILKGKLILGCGANIINSYTNFDYLRIGPDVSLIFDDHFYMRWINRERISTKITLQNTIYRSIFNDHLFGNDPDVFLLRDDNIKLSVEQRKALTVINALFGSVLMTSDDLGKYDESKKETLAYALDLYKNAEVTSYSYETGLITIKYNYKGGEHQFVYNVKKGVLVYDR